MTAVHEPFPCWPRETRLPLTPSAYISASLCWRSQSSAVFSLVLIVTGGLSSYKLNQGIYLLLSSLLPCGKINPLLSWVPLCYAWSGCTGWAGHVMKSCRQLRSKALETTTGFLECWHQLHERWQGCFVKDHKGSEGRPVLHQIHCCRGRDLLAVVFALSLKTNSTCVFKIS